MLPLFVAVLAAQSANSTSKASASAAVAGEVLSVDRAKTILEAATAAAGLDTMESTKRVTCSLQANPDECERAARSVVSEEAKAQVRQHA